MECLGQELALDYLYCLLSLVNGRLTEGGGGKDRTAYIIAVGHWRVIKYAYSIILHQQ